MQVKLRIEQFPGGGYILTNAPLGKAQCKECEQWLPEEQVAKSLLQNVCARCKFESTQKKGRERYLKQKEEKEERKQTRDRIRRQQDVRTIEEKQEALRQGRRKFNTW